MTLSRQFAGHIFCGVILAASAMPVHAQEDRKRPSEGDRKSAPDRPRAEPHSAPESSQPHSAPERRTPPPAQQNAPQTQHREAVTPQRAPSSPQPAQHDSPAQAPRMRQQPQPDSVPGNRNQQPPARSQPSRTFGNQPGRPYGNQPGSQNGSQPGRTFGRGAEPSSGQSPAASPRTFTNRSGDVIHRDSNGQVRQVQMSNGTVVYHPPNAPRRVEMVRPGGRIIVAGAPGHGYVQRPVVIRNTTIIKRTYIYNGVPQARFYRPRVYNGITLAIYTPARYYRPTFYAYAYDPWPRPISYGWGWGGSPWYGYYGGYFTPYPVYASPSLWLTDFLIAATLETAYEERMAARSTPAVYQAAGQSAPMTPEVKQAIADEVRRQIDQERAEGQTANSPAGQENIFADNASHVFVSNATFAVNSNAGECAITEGAVLQMNSAPPPNSQFADLTVLSSRGQDCRKGSRVSVALQDLQEMHNQMLATLDRGLADLQSKQGQGGLPNLPQGSTGTIDSPFAQEAQPDPNAASELNSVAQEADRAEQAVNQSDSAPPTLSLGLSIDDVKSIQGEPQKIVDLGSRKIYVYKDLKITFTNGKVTDIQ